MAIFGLGQRTQNSIAVITPLWELRASATADVAMLELAITQTTGGATGPFGFGRSAAAGLLPIGAQAHVSESDATGMATSEATGCIAWGTAPTVPTNYLRRGLITSGIGYGLCWIFPRGIHVTKATSLVLYSTATANQFDIWSVISE